MASRDSAFLEVTAAFSCSGGLAPTNGTRSARVPGRAATAASHSASPPRQAPPLLTGSRLQLPPSLPSASSNATSIPHPTPSSSFSRHFSSSSLVFKQSIVACRRSTHCCSRLSRSDGTRTPAETWHPAPISPAREGLFERRSQRGAIRMLWGLRGVGD